MGSIQAPSLPRENLLRERVYKVRKQQETLLLELFLQLDTFLTIVYCLHLPWVPEVYTFPIQTAGRRLAKRADSTKRTKWVNYWSRVTPGSNRQKPHFHVNATLLWSRLILVSDQTGFPTWEVKYVSYISYHIICIICRVVFTFHESLSSTSRWTMSNIWLERPTDKQWQGWQTLKTS